MFQTFNDTLYIEFIKHTFLNIIPNGVEHIHTKKKSYITYSIFLKTQPCPCLYIYNLLLLLFSLRNFFKLCCFNDQKHFLDTKKRLSWIIKLKHIFKFLMIPCPHNHQYMVIHKFSKLMVWFYIR